MEIQENTCFKRPNEICAIARRIADKIADAEAAIACILAAECEKLKRVIYCDTANLKDILAVNNSVEDMVEAIAKLEEALAEKLEAIIPLLKDCNRNS